MRTPTNRPGPNRPAPSRPGAWPDEVVYGLDIETDTSVDGLDPDRAAVVAVALSTAAGDQVVEGPEADLLTEVDARLADLPPGLLVTWNGAAFDMPFLARRAERLGIPLGLELRLDPSIAMRREPLAGHHGAYRARWGHHHHLDAYRLYRADVGRTLGLSCGLKPMAMLVGLLPHQVAVSELHLLPTEEVRAYVASDARATRTLALRRMPAAATFADRMVG